MRLIVGLGNPGKKYKHTRHNVGFMVLDCLVDEGGVWQLRKKVQSEVVETALDEAAVILAKPQTLMNSSGGAVRRALTSYRLSFNSLLIVHDDLDLPFGKFKLQFGTGPKDHNGVLSVEQELGTPEFWRLRVGIDNRVGGDGAEKWSGSGERYVLSDFTPQEEERLQALITERVVPSISEWAATPLE